MKFIDRSGIRYGYLTVIERSVDYVTPSGTRRVQWLCRCDCGATISVGASNLSSGKAKSCGCKRTERAIALGRASRREVVTYAAAHYRVRAAKGRAIEAPCVDCGEQASQWSYDGLDPDALMETRTFHSGERRDVSYSLDPAHYDARCRSCHSRFDRLRGPRCSLT